MLIAFTGDPYLAREAARKEARLLGLPPRLLPASSETVAALLQPGLFGETAGILDLSGLDEAEWRPLKESLERARDVAKLLLYDPKATAGRTRFYKNRGEVRNFPTPRFRERTVFVQNLLKSQGIKAPAAVIHLLAESEADTEGLVREVEKLALLEGPITPERILPLLSWPPATSAFDLLEPLSRREPGDALAIARNLLDRGEPPLRILGALSWHYARLAELGYLLEKEPRVGEERIAKELGIAPFAARRLLAAYRRIGSGRVQAALAALLEAELAIKTGSDPETRLLALLAHLAR